MNTRRRGAELENAILQAAWQELMEVGYQRVTIEGVANRAETGKPVIYRRWANRDELIIAAIQKNIPKPVENAPDTGYIRSDVIIVLERLNDLFSTLTPETMFGIMSVFVGIPFAELLNMRKTNTMQTILKRAVERGEIQEEKITERITTLPIDLIRNEVLTTYEPVTKKIIEEIVDEIFLPLIT